MNINSLIEKLTLCNTMINAGLANKHIHLERNKVIKEIEKLKNKF